MQINIAGHHVDLTEGIKESVNSKFSKISLHFPDLDSVSVTLTVERNEQKVEAHSIYKGATVSASASNTDMYVAIAEAARKLEANLNGRKRL